MAPLDRVNLPRLMSLSEGRPEIALSLIDGPVNTSLADLAPSLIRDISSGLNGSCDRPDASGCKHGTLVAGVLIGRRGSIAPGICPSCTLLLMPIFAAMETAAANGMQNSSPADLAVAIIASVKAGAKIINLSCAISHCSSRGESSLHSALTFAAAKGVVVVAAAGNQSRVAGSCITQHPWVIPVVALDDSGRPANETNLSIAIAKRGLAAPGRLTSFSSDGTATQFAGTSAACPLVSGSAALLWSLYPGLSGADIRLALTGGPRRSVIVPPALDAWAAFNRLKMAYGVQGKYHG